MKIVFMGSGSFACPLVGALAQSAAVELVAVVTQPDRPRGRKLQLAACPVKELMASSQAPILTPEKIGDAESELRALGAELFVVADYGQYIPSSILAIPPRKAINVHPSLLPKYRGASPLQWTLANGDAMTGVTVLYVSKRMDAGDILLQQEFEVYPEETAPELEQRLATAGGSLLLRAIDLMHSGHLHATPQDEARATHARKLEKADGVIDWTAAAETLKNRVRAFQPWPGQTTATPRGLLKVWSCAVEEGSDRLEPGTVAAISGAGPLVATGSGALRLLEVQPEGKRRMTGAEYANGKYLRPEIAWAFQPHPEQLMLPSTMSRFVPMFLSLVLLIVPAAAGERVALDLRGCYERALEQIEAIGIAAAELRAAEARYRQGRDSLAPDVSLNAQEELQNERDEDEPDQFEARLSAEQVLYSGFRITRAYEALGKESDALRFDEKRLRELLYLDVSDVYHQILFYEKDEAILRELAGALDETVAELDKRTSLGRSRRADLLKAQADRAETLVELETTRGQLQLARELMAYLLNLPADGFELRAQSPFPADPAVEDKLAAVAARADVQAGEARVEASRKRVEAARGERQPEVAASADLYLLESPDQDHEWNISLTFALPLFDEGVIKARVAERAEQVRISELNLASVRRSAASEVRSAYIAFMAALAQRERLKEAIATSRENYEVQKRDYELGRSSQLDALNALSQVHRLRRRDAAASLRANDSLVRLHVAAGEVNP